MDAVMFIALIGIAVTILCQAGSDEQGDVGPDVSETLDALFESKIDSELLGFETDNRVMKISDVVALSVGHGRTYGLDYIRECLDRMYPWTTAYGLSLEYGSSVLDWSMHADESSSRVTRTYPVEYGGELVVTLVLYG
ncbi:MAG: hypothetical protein MJZ38_07525 [archaeon]|nr:hypothetical protein [archaeon]